ncbi:MULTISPECIES: beta-galactosidase [Streptomyces]|uniref:beta-galactosidase n=1 Tax=Streptomyces TaxID=1883 RepID=UPI001F1076FE|nr:beta-galactosidase [Streptomyces sp. Z423-1]
MPRSTTADERLAALRKRLGGLGYGGDYNPEQWPPEVWREDVRLMREAGVNLVTVGVFSWGLLEPRPATFDFGWLDEVMDLLARNGIAVDLATPTAAPPSWLAHEHPETLPVDGEGRTIAFGARLHYCPSSPVYRDHAARITERLADRYAGHPALAMWHIANEYVGLACHCPVSTAHFRRWLADRYDGSIAALNDAWGTAFWGQRYDSFDHIGTPAPRSRLVSGPNPGQLLDFRRFCDAAALECFTAERDTVRRHTPDLPVTTNFMGSFRSLDYWSWAAEEDVAALDIYPKPHDPDGHLLAAYNFDLMRSLRHGRPWLLLESATGNNLAAPRNPARPAGQLRGRGLQAVARGSDSVMYFQWRASRAGAERFHSAMLPHGGTRTRTWREVTAFGHDLARLSDLSGGACDRARVAMAWDYDSLRALEGPDHPSDHPSFTAQVMEHYRPLWGANIPVDFVRPADDLSGYRLLVVPNLYLVDGPAARRLARYVQDGGHLLMSYFSGIVDEHDRVWPGGHPGAFRDLLGIDIDDFNPLQVGETRAVRCGEHRGTATDWQDVIVPRHGTESVAVYTDGELQGHVAAVRNRYGRGVATYLGTSFDRETMRLLVLEAAAAAGAEPVLDTPDGVEAVRRRDADGTPHLFLLNHSAREAVVDLRGAAPRDAADLLTPGAPPVGDKPLTLPPYGAAVLKPGRGTQAGS